MYTKVLMYSRQVILRIQYGNTPSVFLRFTQASPISININTARKRRSVPLPEKPFTGSFQLPKTLYFCVHIHASVIYEAEINRQFGAAVTSPAKYCPGQDAFDIGDVALEDTEGGGRWGEEGWLVVPPGLG